MTTLTQKPPSSLLDRLFIDAEAAEEAVEQEMTDIPPEQRAAGGADYRQLYARLRDQPLPVSRATGALLYTLARSIAAQNVVEFGTSFGISTFHLAAALRDNGGGRLIGSEFEPLKAARARKNSRPPTCPIWSTFAKAMRLRHSPATCLSRLTLSFWMEPRTSIRPFYPCWRAACASAH